MRPFGFIELTQRVALPVILLLSLAVNCYQLSWGLPNGNSSWAADALGPLTVFSIARRSVVPFNSGWFYFKYSLGYPLTLLASFVPYLSILMLSGRLRHPVPTYPYGFANPEAALYMLTLSGRVLSVAMVVAVVALTYGIGRRLLGRPAALLAAWLVATAYPVIYYAHTTNLDAAYLFWLTLALWATVVATENDRRWPYVTLGIAAAMAMATKEQGFALLSVLPLIIVVHGQCQLPAQGGPLRRWWAAAWNGRTRVGLVAAVITIAIADNAITNPRGFVNRFLNLTGHQLPGVTARLTPLEFSLFKGSAKEWQYISQLGHALDSTFGLPLFLVVVAGVIYVGWRRTRAALYLLLPAAAYYFVSLRTHDLITLRYTLPLVVIGSLCAGAVALAVHAVTPRLASVVIVGLCALSFARAVELDLLLQHDSRYQVERWLKSHATAANTIETYQKAVYLPRLSGFDHREVPLEQRTLDGIEQRRPDFIIISSAAKKGITHRWNPDWRQGHTLLIPGPGAAAFLDALEREQLPYRRVARFEQRPMLLRLRITSLCPEISIFQRTVP
jgi:hypothetical protein